MANVMYNAAKGKDLAWTSGDWRVLLTTSAYSPDIDADEFVADVANELSGTGYVRKALASKSVNIDTAADLAEFIAGALTWEGLDTGSTPAKAVVFKQVTNDADSWLLCCVDLTPAVDPEGSDLTVRWNGGSPTGTVITHG